MGSGKGLSPGKKSNMVPLLRAAEIALDFDEAAGHGRLPVSATTVVRRRAGEGGDDKERFAAVFAGNDALAAGAGVVASVVVEDAPRPTGAVEIRVNHFLQTNQPTEIWFGLGQINLDFGHLDR